MPPLPQYPFFLTLQRLALRRKVAVYLVGGFLRDHLLDRASLDFDLAVASKALPLARSFSRKIKGTFVLLDEGHGCARVVKKHRGELLTFDFADFRAGSLRGDLSKRDFTINTLTVDLFRVSESVDWDNVLEDHKKARLDIKAKRVRMVSTRAFRDDPLRMLRAFSLKAQLGFKVERETLQQIRKDRDLLRGISVERIREELFKVFSSTRAAVTVRELDRIGLLERIIPQITMMYGIKQGGYHHLDVWRHSLETVVQQEKIFGQFQEDTRLISYLDEKLGGGRSRRALMILAAMLHDVGKPQTRVKLDQRTAFHGHERAGRDIVRLVAKDLKLSTRERFALQDMVLWHLRPGYLSNFKRPSERAFFRYLRDAGNEAASIALLSLADQRSTCGPLTSQADQDHHEKICLEILARVFAARDKKPLKRLINGHDLIRRLHLKPSPLFAKILSEVEEAQATGRIKTKVQALALARKVCQKGMS